jgi:hypothetical protein
MTESPGLARRLQGFLALRTIRSDEPDNELIGWYISNNLPI